MRFELRKERALDNCDNTYRDVVTAKVKVKNRITFSLPTTSYYGFNNSRTQRFVMIEYGYWEIRKVLHDLSQGLQLKLERVGDDYKLALVTSSGRPTIITMMTMIKNIKSSMAI